MDGPNVPPLYDAVFLDEVDSVLEEARRRAAAGNDEGTLIWSRSQSTAELVGAGDWTGQPGDFNCALILRPELGLKKAFELVHVTNVALLSALAGLVEPGMDLRHHWPNKLLANDGWLGTTTLLVAPGDTLTPEWLVVGAAVHLENHPHGTSMPTTSIRYEQGKLEFTSAALLESFSRHMLTWISRWTDEGFGPIGRAFQSQMDERKKERQLELDGSPVAAFAEGVDEHGGLKLSRSAHGRETISLMHYFGYGEDPLQLGADSA